jgi:hypothetical protein
MGGAAHNLDRIHYAPSFYIPLSYFLRRFQVSTLAKAVFSQTGFGGILGHKEYCVNVKIFERYARSRPD